MDHSFEFQEQDLFYFPRKKALPLMNNTPNEPEMSEFESAYLAGLIRKFKPNKLLEVGIAAGGTTGIIIETLQETRSRDENIKIFSVDLNKKYYRDQNAEKYRKSGFMTDLMKENTEIWVEHKCILGKAICECFNEIDHDIDFVIIDTVHYLPGELLDIPIILKMVSPNAVIVFHDISYHHYCVDNESNEQEFATMSAFLSISGNKNIPIGLDPKNKVPNIGAIQITPESFNNISNVFYAMNLPWKYVPNKLILEAYLSFYKKFYSDYESIYKNTFEDNIKHVTYVKEQYFAQKFSKVISKLDAYKEVSIYGAGEICTYFLKILNKKKIAINKIYVTKKDRFSQQIENYKITEYTPDQIKNGDVVVIASEKFANEISDLLSKNSNCIFLSINDA